MGDADTNGGCRGLQDAAAEREGHLIDNVPVFVRHELLPLLGKWIQLAEMEAIEFVLGLILTVILTLPLFPAAFGTVLIVWRRMRGRPWRRKLVGGAAWFVGLYLLFLIALGGSLRLASSRFAPAQEEAVIETEW